MSLYIIELQKSMEIGCYIAIASIILFNYSIYKVVDFKLIKGESKEFIYTQSLSFVVMAIL